MVRQCFNLVLLLPVSWVQFEQMTTWAGVSPALRTTWKNSRAKDCSATKGQQLAESRSSEPSLLGFTALMVVLSDPCTCHSHSQPSWHTASHRHHSAASVHSLILNLPCLLIMCAKSRSVVSACSKHDLIITLLNNQHSSDNRKLQNDNGCGSSLAHHECLLMLVSATVNWMAFRPINSHAVELQAEQTDKPLHTHFALSSTARINRKDCGA